MPKFWLVTHGFPIFPKLRVSRVHTYSFQFSNQNKIESKYLQPELFWGKNGVSMYSQTISSEARLFWDNCISSKWTVNILDPNQSISSEM